MKNLKILAAVAATALFLADPASAQGQSAEAPIAANQTAGSVEMQPTQDAPAFAVQTLTPQLTAAAIIGQPLYNSANQKIGTVRDIILDQSGKAETIVVSNAIIPGFESAFTAFDYNSVAAQSVDGSVILALPDQALKQARIFEYGEGNQPVTPGYSTAQILDAELFNPQNESVAQIDNISLVNGQAKDLIIAFDQVLGFGGKKATMDFQSAKIINESEGVSFQLSAAQASQLENFKNAAEE